MEKYTFGNKIYKLRTESNLTQKELAGILGVSDKAVSKWETGEAMPRVKTLKNIADCFSVTYEDLLSQTEELKSNESEKNEAYKLFYQKRVARTKDNISVSSIVVFASAIMNFIIKIILLFQLELAGFSGKSAAVFLGDFLPAVFAGLMFISLKKYLKADNLFTRKQFDRIFDIQSMLIGSQIFALLLNLDFENISFFLCLSIIIIILCVLDFYVYFTLKKQKEVKNIKGKYFLFTVIILLCFLIVYLIVSSSFTSIIHIAKMILINFTALYIIYEMFEYQALLGINKDEMGIKPQSRAKRNVKKIVSVCLAVVIIFSVFIMFVPGITMKIAAKTMLPENQETLFYDELDISFENEKLLEYEFEGIKFSLPETYVASEKDVREHTADLKFSKPNCQDFNFMIVKSVPFSSEELNIPQEIFSGEYGSNFKKMIENTFGYYPKTNSEWNRLIYTINPDDANIFDIQECITYLMLVMSRKLATHGGVYDFEYFDNGIFYTEICKIKHTKLTDDGEIEKDEKLYSLYSAVITLYNEEYKEGYYQIVYRPESGGNADLKLLHKVLNTIEKVE